MSEAQVSPVALPELRLRNAKPGDAAAISAIDARHTGVAKPEHWAALLKSSRKHGGVGLVAQQGAEVKGFLLGEVRAWEFGSPPAGWVYAVGVDAAWEARGIGQQLVAAARERFATLGVANVRTMVRRDHVAMLRFFRGAGFVAGPFVELEASCDVP